jgi:hypothetical protein
MADPQEIALLLYQLIQAAEKEAEKEASASGVGLQYDRYVPVAKGTILKTYEECVGSLSDKDRAELDRIVREMLATIPKANQ